MLTPIQDIQPFIDLGYHTAPLNGKHIIRDEHGKKKGFSFQPEWKKTYSTTLNTLATPIGVVLTGKGNNVVAIDCDCKASWELFRSLDPHNTAFFESIGKLDKEGNEIECGTILYTYSDNLPPNKSIKGGYDIDWINGVNSIFLPTEANHTKTAWQEDEDYKLYNHLGELVFISPMPPLVQTVLELTIEANELPTATKTVATTGTSQRAKGYLGKILNADDIKDNLAEDKYDPKITRLLTPKAFRTPKYEEQGHLHPNDIDGSGHDYLFKIMCHLAGDNTVDEKLARACIIYLNSLWDRPIPTRKLENTIISGIVSGRQVNTSGDPYWVYDENWETLHNWSYVNRRNQHLMEIFYDDMRMTHYIYNTDTDEIIEKIKKSEVINHVLASNLNEFDQYEAYSNMANVLTRVDPREDFGYLNHDKDFNLFKPTRALRILADPSLHKEEYKRPNEFINFMDFFIPDPQQRGYLLSLLRTKLTTFDYSPVIPYIIGVQGSGKGNLMAVIENIIGAQYVSKDVQGKNFISEFNKGFLENKYFVNVNELSEGLTTVQERTKAQGDLKNYTGSTTFQCHGKGTNVYTAEMKAMFILTANHNPLDIEDGDRRVYYISTPNRFVDSPQCRAVKDASLVRNTMVGDVENIAYWMATEIENLDSNDYLTAPHHSGRNKMIFDGKYPASKLAWALKHKEFRLIEEEFVDPTIFNHKEEGRVYLADLVRALESTFKVADPERDIKKAIKSEGYLQNRGTKNAIYYNVSGIKTYEPMVDKIEEDETAEDIRL